MAHPLDMPEIRRLIAQLMTRHDLTVCLRISKDWNQTCLPLLWQKLNLVWSSQHDRVTRVVDRASIHRHSHLLKTLSCGESHRDTRTTTAAVVSDIYFRNLEDLAFSAYSHDQADFTRRHRHTLVHLDLSSESRLPDQERESNELWSAIATCQKLRTLKINQVSVTQAAWPGCWYLFSRLTALHLKKVDFTPLTTLDVFDESEDSSPQIQPTSLLEWLAEVCGPRQQVLGIKTLKLTNNLYTGPEDELAILAYCPDLEILHWHPADTHPQPTSEQLGRHLAEQTRHCPKLVNTSLCVRGENSDALSPFLETKVGLSLQELGLSGSFFSRAAWDLVRTKHTFLRCLDLWDVELPYGMAHKMLCNLPANIENLSVRPLQDQHLKDDRRPWICPGLKSLSLGVDVVGDSLKGQNLIMRQIAMVKTLNHLKVLTDKGIRQVLLFRLESGLGHLATLQDLRELNLKFQRLAEEDVRWMVDNWPRLYSVIGLLHPTPAMNSFLRKILSDRGVVVHAPNYDVRVHWEPLSWPH